MEIYQIPKSTFGPVEIHESWTDFFSENNDLLKEIVKDLRVGAFAPDPQNILRFAQTNANKIKCVWLGLDPYVGTYFDENGIIQNIATGRSFEVGGFTTWQDKKCRKSLQNILKLLYKTYRGQENVPIAHIREDIQSGVFNIAEPDVFFDDMEKQGVLFLNAGLTVDNEKGAKSHLKLWEPFTTKLIEYIAEKNPEAYWFIWGRDADKVIDKAGGRGNIMYSNHPSRLNSNHPQDFMKSQCFDVTKKKIKWVK